MKTKILEHVRNVCKLKELKFGCEVVSREFEGRGKIIGCGIKYIIQQPALNDGLSSEHSTYQLNESQFTIIGLPVHLEHLLFALNMCGDERYEKVSLKGNKLRILTPTNYTETSIEYGVGINNEQYGSVVNDVWVDLEIDLSKTVEQNLEDEALCKLLVEVLNIK